MHSPRTIYDRIAALVHPLPVLAAGDIRAADPDVAAEVLADEIAAVVAAREYLAAQLEVAEDEAGMDPLLTAIGELAAARDAADAKIRDLIAYAREFLPRRSYTLAELAEASVRSTSWVDTAYGKPATLANPVIYRVAHATDATPNAERGAGKANVPQGVTAALSDPRYRTITVANRPFNAEFTDAAGEPGQGSIRRIAPGTNGEETVPLDPADLPKAPGYALRPTDTDDQTS